MAEFVGQYHERYKSWSQKSKESCIEKFVLHLTIHPHKVESYRDYQVEWML